MSADLADVVLATRTLLDRNGRVWRWNPRQRRRPGDAPGVFCHDALMRTEQEIENDAEPIIELRDPRVLTVPLAPVPVHELRLGELVVLPGLGELSPVIGLWPCHDGYLPRLYVCTDNGDWARRSATSSVLCANNPPRSSTSHPSHPG